MGILAKLKKMQAEKEDAGPILKKLDTLRFNGFSHEQLAGFDSSGIGIYDGKVRQCISVKSGDLFLLHTDRLSAFDRFVASVPLKGSVLAAIATYWHHRASEVIPSAWISQPHERVLRQKQLKPVMAEFIVRGYLAGSMLKEYQQGQRSFCGQALPDGLKPWGTLPTPLVTPTSKAEKGDHDENRTPERLIDEGVVSPEEWEFLHQKSLELFALGSRIYGEKGWILVDTKYEFGRDEDGKIFLMDELHTPDSSRLWKAHSYQERLSQGLYPDMFDKEIVRRYLKNQGWFGEGSVPPVPSNLLLELLVSYLAVAEDLWEKELDFGTPLLTEDLSNILGIPVG